MRIVLVVFLSILMLVTPLTTTAQTQPTDLEISIHRKINNVRTDGDHEKELAPLKLHSKLIKIARQHSENMAENGFFAHEDPSGDTVSDRVSENGIDYDSVGENLALVSKDGKTNDQIAKKAVEGWVDSPGHYKNIITPFGYTGIGVAISEDYYYITQVFVSADESEMEQNGDIFDNNQLDELETEDEGFNIDRQWIYAGIIILVILIGLDAKRRNKEYRRRKYRG